MPGIRSLTPASAACAAALALVACGPATPGGPGPHDPRLDAAAGKIGRAVAGSRTYAGLVLDARRHTITVYRRPDRALDARIRAAAPHVKLVLRTAPYSLTQMRAAIRRVLADRAYWRHRRITINGAAARPTGTGVIVFVPDHPERARRELSGRYPRMPITVRKQTAVHPIWTGPAPTITVSGPLPPKSTVPGH